MIRYGLCCISAELYALGHKYQTLTVAQYSKLAAAQQVSKVMSVLHNNLDTTLLTMQHCYNNGWVYRMSSSLYPLLNYAPAKLTWDIALQDLEVVAKLADMRTYLATTKLRVSLHPDQFVVPASKRSDICTKSLAELENHATFMDLLGLSRSYMHPINIHMNSYLGDSLTTIAARFSDAYSRLSIGVTSRLVLENEDKPNSWNTLQLHDHIYSKLGIPITYDCLHHRCNQGGVGPEQAVKLAVNSWGDYRPLFHYSGSDPENSNIRKHAMYPVGVPLEFYNLDDVDFDVEFGAKDLAIRKIIEKYPTAYEISNTG